MSTHNICFHEEIRKMSKLLDWKKCLNYSYELTLCIAPFHEPKITYYAPACHGQE